MLEQLKALEAAGFSGVDVFWAKGGNALFGGYKTSRGKKEWGKESMRKIEGNRKRLQWASSLTLIFYTFSLLIWSVADVVRTGKLGFAFIIFIVGQCIFSLTAMLLVRRKKE